jgi:tetratricopeptide (TPR) repeat protein
MRIGSGFAESLAALFLGKIALERGELTGTIARFKQSAEAATRCSYPFMVILGTAALARAYTEIGPHYHQQIGKFHERAMKQLEHPTGVTAAGFAWVDLGFCLLQNGRADDAAELFVKGLTVPTTHGLLNRPMFLVGAAHAELQLGNVEQAAVHLREARALVDGNAVRYMDPVVSLAEGKLARARGELEAALDRLADAEAKALALGMRPIVWQARAEQAQVLESLGRPAEAQTKQEGGRAMIEEIGALIEDPEMRTAFIETALGRVGAI